jgi:Fe-S-cluster-containing dehydrogenase component
MEGINIAEALSINQKVLIYQSDLCSGCMLCLMVCSAEHYDIFDLKKASIRIIENPEQEGKYLAIHCTHCEHPICEIVCPSNAIFKDNQTGAVQIDSMKCVGCKNCIISCPISAIWFDQTRATPIKCDLCDGDPKCVKFCITHALTLVPRAEAKTAYRNLRTGR